MVHTQRLKYLGYAIVLQEVPDEISLAINISGCPHKCEGCHSQYLWEYKGFYVSDNLPALIEKYAGYITCVCFMGGDQNMGELIELCNYVHSCGLKCCLYSGLDDFPVGLSNFDYVKIGRYNNNLGGLDKPTTNQRMYKKESNSSYIDITYKFKKEEFYAEDF